MVVPELAMLPEPSRTILAGTVEPTECESVVGCSRPSEPFIVAELPSTALEAPSRATSFRPFWADAVWLTTPP